MVKSWKEKTIASDRLSWGLKSIIHRTADVLGSINPDFSSDVTQFIELLLLLSYQHNLEFKRRRQSHKNSSWTMFFVSLPLLHRCVQTFGNSAVHRDTGRSLETPDHGVPCLIINSSWLRSVIRGIWRAPGITSEEHNVGSYLWESCGKASSQALGSQTRGRQKRRRKKKKKSAFFLLHFWV